jgi:hypothetical protein
MILYYKTTLFRVSSDKFQYWQMKLPIFPPLTNFRSMYGMWMELKSLRTIFSISVATNTSSQELAISLVEILKGFGIDLACF